MIFVMLPGPEAVLQSDMQIMLSNFFLMKLGGQVKVTKTDLEALARDYAGYMVLYNPKEESFVLTMKTRPSEYPAPELRGPSEGNP